DRNREGYSVYATFNRIENITERSAGDEDVARRMFLVIDLDTDRPTGTVADEGQRTLAMQLAGDVRTYLVAQGWGEPARVHDSGNGVHLFYRVDLPADDEK